LRLDKIEKAIDSGHHDIAEREISKLRTQLATLPQNSVVIKEAAAALARLAEENFWISLSHQKLEFLRAEIKPLFRTVSEADFKAMRFERDLLEYSLAVLNEEKEQAETLKEGIVEQISELPLSVGFVKQEETLIVTDFPACIGTIKAITIEDDLSPYEYATIFDQKAIEVLKSPEFIAKASEFNERYQELFNQAGNRA